MTDLERLEAVIEVADTDQEMSLVDRLRLGGPNAMEVAGDAANEIERLRKENEELKADIAHMEQQPGWRASLLRP